jgi:hypothetical protein
VRDAYEHQESKKMNSDSTAVPLDVAPSLPALQTLVDRLVALSRLLCGDTTEEEEETMRVW